MKPIYAILKNNKGANLAVIYILSLIMATFLNSFLGLDAMVQRNGANTDISISQSDTAQLVDRFADNNDDGFGTNDKSPNLSYENFNDSTKYNIHQEIDANNKIVQEQDAWLNDQTSTKSKSSSTMPTYKPISEEELISRSERRNSNYSDFEDNNYSGPTKKLKASKDLEDEETNGFNTIKASKTKNETVESAKTRTSEEINVKIFSASNQTLSAGSKASFILKEDLGDLKKGDAVYGRVTESGNSFQLVFSGKQFGMTKDLYLYSGNERGIVFGSELNDLKNELTQESKNQGGQIVGDVVRNIPIIGNAGSRLIYRAGQGGGRRNVSIEIIKGERFTLMND